MQQIPDEVLSERRKRSKEVDLLETSFQKLCTSIKNNPDGFPINTLTGLRTMIEEYEERYNEAPAVLHVETSFTQSALWA